ncbi:hypothetical protein P7K49_026529 [Saguinus oedipus]|uniref:Uncharacterized protein n=1 Tax=Saguinus oedipus TaxID=9490 RepID=A0ABQ9UDD9_SAGOE|nr:hypothetical protein P7K49_026529 [Saguinus oedipus]
MELTHRIPCFPNAIESRSQSEGAKAAQRTSPVLSPAPIDLTSSLAATAVPADIGGCLLNGQDIVDGKP